MPVEIFQQHIDYYRPQTKFAKVMFLHPSVSHSVHGGCLPQCMLGYTPPGSRHPPAQCMLGDAGNKRAVRILLEYILAICYACILSLDIDHRK